MRMARDVMHHMPKPGVSLPRILGRDVRPGKSADIFKVPALPAKANSQSAVKNTGSIGDEDVFGIVDDVSGKQKGRTAEKPGSDELEKANKTVSHHLCASHISRSS